MRWFVRATSSRTHFFCHQPSCLPSRKPRLKLTHSLGFCSFCSMNSLQLFQPQQSSEESVCSGGRLHSHRHSVKGFLSPSLATHLGGSAPAYIGTTRTRPASFSKGKNLAVASKWSSPWREAREETVLQDRERTALPMPASSLMCLT